MIEHQQEPRSSWLAWAAFLAASWTWCIGMFLPRLLVRDYGVLGWVVFALPNVVGAAAMGWTLKKPADSAKLVAAHRTACLIFSACAIAFHAFFAVAVISPLAGSLDLGLGTVIVLSILGYTVISRRQGADLLLAGVSLVVSLVAAVVTIHQLARSAANLPDLFHGWHRNPVDLVWLAPVCVFGFAACPYLDLTFHRALQSSRLPRRSFGVGFGVLFFAMIAFTLIYSGVFDDPLTWLLGTALFVHMAVQSSFTVAVHIRELGSNGWAVGMAAAISVIAIGAHWLLPRNLAMDGQNPGELIYRAFMGFYGLVFPAYVWLVVFNRRGWLLPTRRSLIVFAAAVIVAAPMFWLGFVAGRMLWLVPGLGLVLVARVLIREDRCESSGR